MDNGQVVIVENIVTTPEGSKAILGRYFLETHDLYSFKIMQFVRRPLSCNCCRLHISLQQGYPYIYMYVYCYFVALSYSQLLITTQLNCTSYCYAYILVFLYYILCYILCLSN